MKTLVAATISLVAASGAFANDKPINPKVTLENLDTAFEMAAAELKSMATVYANGCDEGPPASCSFNSVGKQEIRGMGAALDAPPSNITIFYQPGGDPTPFVMNVGFLVSICEPQMKQEERGKIIAKIVKAAGGIGEGLIDGQNADFAVTNLAGTILVVAEKASND